jgi:pantothenate kinase
MNHLLRAIQLRSATRQRFIVAIAGAPAAGKSTFAVALARELPNSRVLQMDGFHYDNAVLDEAGLRSRKGAPETFDYPGFAATIKRIRDQEPNIAIPVFDRTMDLARAGAVIVSESVKFIVVEGNYLLLDEPPWTGLAGYFDLTVFLEAPRPELHRRLMSRWLDLGRTPEQAANWVNSNDMPNVDRVLSCRRPADFTFGPEPLE